MKIQYEANNQAEVGAFQVVLPNIHYKKIEEKLLVDNSFNKNIEKNTTEIKPLYMDILNFVTDKNGSDKKRNRRIYKFQPNKSYNPFKRNVRIKLNKKRKG